MNSEINNNSQYFSLAPQNGTGNFTAGNKIIFEINPNIGFVKGKDCYLAFDVFNSSANNEIIAFPPTAGANSMLDRIDIYSLNNGTLLESLQNINQWSALENQYSYDVKEPLVAKEGTSGECYAYKVTQNAGTGVTTHGANIPQANKLGDMLLSPVEGGKAVYMAKRYVLPLRSGIFNWWSLEEKLTPIVLYSGLRIEITLADNNKVCNNVLGIDGTGTNDVTTESFVLKVDAAVAGGANPVLFSNTTNFSTTTKVEQCGFVVGNKVSIKGTINGVADTRTATITGLAVAAAPNANRLQITLGSVSGANITAVAGTIYMFLTSSNKSYTIKKAELKLLQVLPTQQMLKQTAKESQVSYLSYDLFLDTLPTSSLSHQTEITSVANRAKAIFSLFSNTSKETDNSEKGYYNGLVPNNVADARSMRMNSIQYFIDNKLYPLKEYNPQRTADKVQAHNEVIKAWSSINKPCRNLGDSKGSNMADYTNTFLVARELARENMVYPLKGSEAELRTKYDGVRTFNSRVFTYVFSEKVVNVANDGLSVIL
tara:strand:- start:1364 stop:2989 length:1626 start_codon:yes stop_codon:yes gene_type:complete